MVRYVFGWYSNRRSTINDITVVVSGCLHTKFTLHLPYERTCSLNTSSTRPARYIPQSLAVSLAGIVIYIYILGLGFAVGLWCVVQR